MYIKPIETVYKGYRFRSRLEARWAVFFDAVGLEWEYEPEGYTLRDGTRYLPDFWIPAANFHAEVKPSADIPDDERRKMRLFDDFPPQYSWGLIYLLGMPSVFQIDEVRNPADGSTPAAKSTWHLCIRSGVWDFQKIALAVTAARSARFEYGERSL